MFCDECKRVLGDLRQHRVNFGIGKVLKHLAHQAELCSRQRIRGQVSAQKGDLSIVELDAVSFNKGFDYIYPNVANASFRSDLASNSKVSTAKIGHAFNPTGTNESNYVFAVFIGGFSLGAPSGIKLLIGDLPPCFAHVDACKSLGEREFPIGALYSRTSPEV